MRPLRTAFLLWAWTPGARTLSRLRERKCAGARYGCVNTNAGPLTPAS